MLSSNRVILFLFGLYLMACFIPNVGSYDAMAPQLFSFCLINLLAAFHLILRKEHLFPILKSRMQDKMFWILLAFVIWHLVSVTVAVNKTESLLNIGRWVTGLIVFVHLSLLVDDFENKSTKIGVYLLSVALMLESFYVLYQYFSGLGKESISLLIYGLTGTAGNKNVLASGMVLKIPFVFYAIYIFKGSRKFLFAFLLLLASLSIFIINARSAILSLGLMTFMYLIFSLFVEFKSDRVKNLKAFSFIIGTVLIALMLSQFFLNLGLKDAEGNKNKTSYGTVVERMSSIEWNNRSSSNRFRLWEDALDYTGKHWFLGAGSGNWKLESIPYTSLEDNDLYVPYHAHNDFLETAAETGLPGLLLYLSIFILAAWRLHIVFYKAENKIHRYYALTILMALMAYGIDAFFNFPSERPVMQLLFFYLLSQVVLISSSKENSTVHNFKFFFPAIILLFTVSISLVYYSYTYYNSMKVQAKLLSEYDKEPSFATEDIRQGLGTDQFFPTISAQFTLPIGAMVARYYIRDGNYEEAMRLITASEAANPYVYFNDFLKGYIFLKQGKYDSAIQYTSRSFHHRPRCKPYFKNHLTAALMVRDSLEIERTFKKYLHYRNEAYAWELYLGAIYEWKGKADATLLTTTDRVRKLFPEDEGLKKLFDTMKSTGGDLSEKERNEKTKMAADLRKKAEVYFGKGAYDKAAECFQKAFTNLPNDFSLAENAGLCQYASGHYAASIPYFEKVLTKGGLPGGKSAFYKALALVQLKKNAEACVLFQIALRQGFDPEQVAKHQKQYCTGQ